MTTPNPKLQDAIRTWARAETAEVIVCRDAEVASVDSDGRVTVRMLTPIAEVVQGETRWTEAPLLPRIPVAYSGTADTQDTYPLAVGQRGLVVIRDVSSSEVDSGQGASPVVTPADPRRWDVVDAVFWPVVLTGVNLPAVAVPSSGRALLVKAGDVLQVGSVNASEAVALASLANTRLDAIEAFLATHTHTGVTTGSGTSGTPSGTPPEGSSVASTRLKVDG